MLVALVGATMFGAMAFAQEDGDDTSWPFDFRQKVQEAIAKTLGIGVEEYDAAVDTAQQQVLDEAVSEGVLTEEQAERMRERFAEGTGPRGMRGLGERGTMMGRRGGFGPMMSGSQGSLLTVAAEELGLTVEQLTAELQDGKTIAVLSAEKGVDLQTIVDSFVAQRADWLAEAVADGRITQQQADLMLAHMQEQVRAHLEAPYAGTGTQGGCFGDRSGDSWQRGPGMMRQGGFQRAPGTSDS
jgi:polyhydroxyalkanoate synthesis regulator phasin